MRITTLVVIGFSLVVPITGAPATDWSLEKMCAFYKGSYEKRQSREDGDVCKLELPTSTGSQEQAEKFCNEYFPYHITKVESGKRTKCTVVATLTCDEEWVQMYGRCYKINRKQMTYDDAKKTCAAHLNSKKQPLGATIAFLHRNALVGRWRDYFSKVYRIWVDGSEYYTQDLVYNEGPNMLLAINGFRYRVKNMALIKVPTSETAFALCEYTPAVNHAESNYLVRRFDEIYYPSVSTDEGVYVRSANSRSRRGVDLMEDSKYCQKVLSPFFPSVEAQSAIPTKAFMKELVKQKSATLIRTSLYSHDAVEAHRRYKECSKSIAANYGMNIKADDNKILFRQSEKVWREGFPKGYCDAASWSAGVQLGRTDSGLEDMSDARSAPIYCQTRFDSQKYGDCPAAYTMYMRKFGQKWCHRFVPDRMLYRNAVIYCAKEGGFISGFSDEKELDLLDKLATTSNAKFGLDASIWMGAERREQCRQNRNGFDSDNSSPCSLERVFEWRNAVAPNPTLLEGKWMPGEPNAVRGEEYCVVMVKGNIQKKDWKQYGYVTKRFNDVVCKEYEQLYHYPICGYEAPIHLTPIEKN